MTREAAIEILEKTAGIYKTEIESGLAEKNYSYEAQWIKVLEMAISALRAQQEAEKNEPLTLDELREMDGEPVWMVCLTAPDLSCWGFHDEDGVCGYCANFSDDDYGKTWLAYCRKPEEGDNG